MNVILLQDVERLGKLGDELKVKDGYARNYLIPRKLAIAVTSGALRVLEQKKKRREREEQKTKQGCQELADKLKEISVTIAMEAGEEDRLFGSVTSEMIAEGLLAEGIEIDKRKIFLEEAIKTLGVYNVDIKVHPEVKAQIRIWVVKK